MSSHDSLSVTTSLKFSNISFHFFHLKKIKNIHGTTVINQIIIFNMLMLYPIT